ncbi:MAG: histidine phosphatase family protein [Acidobacteriota bacterium]
MKTLFLLRHAKSENPEPLSNDLNRALNERGRRAAQAVGTFIKEQNVKFDLVLCSTATRAQETMGLVLAAAELEPNISYDQRIYEAGSLRLLEVVSEIENDVSTVLVVGHNPGLEELVQLLTGQPAQMSTATLAKIDIDASDWNKGQEGKATLDWIVRLKELAATLRSPPLN